MTDNHSSGNSTKEKDKVACDNEQGNDRVHTDRPAQPLPTRTSLTLDSLDDLQDPSRKCIARKSFAVRPTPMAMEGDGSEMYCQEIRIPSPTNADAGEASKDVMDAQELNPEQKTHHSSQNLQIGDHVYQWRSWMGIPGVFQHHGIVMDIQRQPKSPAGNDQNQDEAAEAPIIKLTIADFSNVEHKPNGNVNTVDQQTTGRDGKRRSGLTQEGILRAYTDTDKWHKVEYQAPWWKRSVFRAGTCTAVSSDAVGMVLARVNYILQHPDDLPDYHVVNANCECVAVWCKTGRWCTLQASSFLEMTAAGQVKSSATLAATAATAQVTVQAPAAGLWGWLGFTTATQVSWLSLHPVMIPALAGYAVLSIGAPAVMYVQAKQQWKDTTERLQTSFWQEAMENPEVFAECITHWSDKN